MLQDAALVPLFSDDFMIAARKEVRGLELDGAGTPLLRRLAEALSRRLRATRRGAASRRGSPGAGRTGSRAGRGRKMRLPGRRGARPGGRRVGGRRDAMGPFVVRRLLTVAAAIIPVITLLVFLMRVLVQGDPVEIMFMGQSADRATIERVRRELGWDRPLAVQYAEYVGRPRPGRPRPVDPEQPVGRRATSATRIRSRYCSPWPASCSRPRSASGSGWSPRSSASG